MVTSTGNDSALLASLVSMLLVSTTALPSTLLLRSSDRVYALLVVTAGLELAWLGVSMVSFTAMANIVLDLAFTPLAIIADIFVTSRVECFFSDLRRLAFQS